MLSQGQGSAYLSQGCELRLLLLRRQLLLLLLRLPLSAQLLLLMSAQVLRRVHVQLSLPMRERTMTLLYASQRLGVGRVGEGRRRPSTLPLRCKQGVAPELQPRELVHILTIQLVELRLQTLNLALALSALALALSAVALALSS